MYVNVGVPILSIFLIFFYNVLLSQFILNNFYSSLAYDPAQSNIEGLQHLRMNFLQYPIPAEQSWPLYPLFDKARNSIWVGDTVIDSSRIWEFSITNSSYKEYKLNKISIVTALVLDAKNMVWYLDPLLKRIGILDPNSSFKNAVYNIQTNDTIFGMAIDNKGIIWLTSPDDGRVLRFDTSSRKFEPAIQLPYSRPLGIAFDNKNTIWIADELGSIIRVPSASVDAIYRYSVPSANKTILPSPTAILVTRDGNNIYISNHNDKTVTSFNAATREFRSYKLPTSGLPFGMVMDNLGEIWIAQHTSNESFVLDPSGGELRKFVIPNSNPYVQWMTTDSDGDIWLAEQLTGSLGKIAVQEKITTH